MKGTIKIVENGYEFYNESQKRYSVVNHNNTVFVDDEVYMTEKVYNEFLKSQRKI